MSGPALASLASTVAAVERGADMGALRGAVRSFAAPFGYDRFVLYSAPPPGDGIVERLLWIEGDWFGEGGNVDAEAYLARCPVNRHVADTDAPFFWTKRRSGGQETYRIGRQPRGPGVHGLQVPVFGHAGLTGAMSFGGTSIDSSTDVRLAFTILAIAAFRAAERINCRTEPVAAPRLSKRELEVIRWIASGRRQADIALLLGLSERTIESHLRRIRMRLGATSTAQAVHLLVRKGELGG